MRPPNPEASPVVAKARIALWREQFWQDVRLAARSLRKSPGFATVVILTLATGIGATTAIFSVVNTLLLKPLPYPESERIVQVFERRETGGSGHPSGGGFIDMRDHTTQLEFIASYYEVVRNLTGRGDPVQLRGLEVSPDYLRVLGIQPSLGRGFVAADDAPGGDTNVTVLTHELWQSQFGGDDALVGRTIYLEGIPTTVIGVLPPHALTDPAIALLVPSNLYVMTWKQSREFFYPCEVIGRLRAGASIESASAELTAAKIALKNSYPVFRQNWPVVMTTLHEFLYGSTRSYVLILFLSVGLVLLIACVNVANLLLVRAASHQSDIAVRVALGATTGRIVRQLLTESLLLAVAGGCAGLVLGHWAIRPLLAFTGLEPAPGVKVGLDGPVLLFAIAITGLTGVGFGLFPALTAVRPNPNEVLKGGGRSVGGARRRIQSSLTVGQTGLTVVLLVCAGLLLRSLGGALRADPGFEPKGVLVFAFTQPAAKAPDAEDRVRFTDAVFERLRQNPRVASAGRASSVPMYRSKAYFYGDNVSRADRPETRTDFWPGFDSVAGDFFQSMGIPLLRGRYFKPEENRSTARRVMVINDVFARQLFGGDDPLGHELTFKKHNYEIIGVVGSVRRAQLDVAPTPQVYLPQVFFPVPDPVVVVKVRTMPMLTLDEVRRAVQSVDSDQPIAGLATLEQVVRDSLHARLVMVALLGIFAATALVLACIGLYGVMAYSVAQRTREMGLRLALGAGRGQVLTLIIREGLRLMIYGLGLGVLGSWGAGKLVAGQLYEITQWDPVVLATIIFVLTGVSLLACWLPARRAAKVNPIVALRAE